MRTSKNLRGGPGLRSLCVYNTSEILSVQQRANDRPFAVGPSAKISKRVFSWAQRWDAASRSSSAASASVKTRRSSAVDLIPRVSGGWGGGVSRDSSWTGNRESWWTRRAEYASEHRLGEDDYLNSNELLMIVQIPLSKVIYIDIYNSLGWKDFAIWN